MKLRRFIRWNAALLAAVVSMAAATSAWAVAPPIVPVHGTLSDLNGVPITGTRDIAFALWAEETGGLAPIYMESQSVAVNRGEFVAYLGATGAEDGGVPLELALFRDQGTLWVEITLDGTETVDKRFQLQTAPYGVFAEYCGDASMLGGKPATDYAPAVHTHPWGEITGIPANIADGDDDVAANMACAPGQTVKFTTKWECGGLSEVPTGAVTFFNATACPAGWTEYTAARGRAIVGMPAGGTLADAVGTALTNVENRAHAHTADPASATSTISDPHTHTLDPDLITTSTEGAHTHGTGSGTDHAGVCLAHAGSGAAHAGHTHTLISAGAHSHTIDLPVITSDSAAGHSHTFDIPSLSTGPASLGSLVPFIQMIACRKN
jgi:hypothetical protein